jgi:hypothetical protein
MINALRDRHILYNVHMILHLCVHFHQLIKIKYVSLRVNYR